MGWKARVGLLRWLWLKAGLYRRLVGHYVRFFRPGFHPWQIDDRSLIADAEAALAKAV